MYHHPKRGQTYMWIGINLRGASCLEDISVQICALKDKMKDSVSSCVCVCVCMVCVFCFCAVFRPFPAFCLPSLFSWGPHSLIFPPHLCFTSLLSLPCYLSSSLGLLPIHTCTASPLISLSLIPPVFSSFPSLSAPSLCRSVCSVLILM